MPTVIEINLNNKNTNGHMIDGRMFPCFDKTQVSLVFLLAISRK